MQADFLDHILVFSSPELQLNIQLNPYVSSCCGSRGDVHLKRRNQAQSRIHIHV